MTPVFLSWTFLALFVFGGLRSVRHVGAGGWLAAVVVTGLALFLRLRVATPHHAMYLDEPWYEEAAKNLLQRGRMELCEATWDGESCSPYAKAAGWPALLAIAFGLFGVSEHVAMVTSAVLGSCAAPLAAAAVRAAGGRWHHAIVAGILLAVHPVDVQWSATAETNAAAVTFLVGGFAGVLRRSTAVAIGGLGLAAAIRPELWLAFVPVVIVEPRWRLAVGAAAALFPGYVARSTYAVSGRGELLRWSSTGPNLRLWLTTPGEAGWLSALVVAAGCLGAIVLVRSRDARAAIVLGGAALLIGPFVLCYYPPVGFYSRTMLGAVAPAAVLAALALPGRLAASIVVALLLGFSWTHREELARAPETQAAETALAERASEAGLGADAMIVAEWPTVLNATTALHTMTASRAMADPARLDAEIARRPVYLACDMYCEPRFGGSMDASACRRVLDRYELASAETVGGPRRAYGLFRIIGPARAGARPPCPLAFEDP